MMVIRPARENDLEAIYALADAAGAGLTTLPTSRKRLISAIKWSEESFKKEVKTPGIEYYFLVLEDTSTGKIAGTTGVFATVGLKNPFYNFEIKTERHHSDDPDVDTKTRSLHLGTPYTGAAELGTLFLHKDFRFGGNGTLLSKSRYMLLAAYPDRFNHRVMAEIRGWVDDDGASPFWEAIARHFFKMDLAEADRLNSLGNYQFIADLMPRHPIYIEMLPKSAQAVISKPHVESAPAQRLVESEGFQVSNIIDIFDGGPCLEARLPEIRAVKESSNAEVEYVAEEDCEGRYLIANPELQGFRVTQGPVREIKGGRIGIPAKTGAALGIKPGENVRFVTLKRNT